MDTIDKQQTALDNARKKSQTDYEKKADAIEKEATADFEKAVAEKQHAHHTAVKEHRHGRQKGSIKEIDVEAKATKAVLEAEKPPGKL